MNWTQQPARAVAAAIADGKEVVVKERATAQDFKELSLVPNDCHRNAEKFAEKHQGEVVRGWIVRQPNLYITHSIVKLGGIHYEVTPGIDDEYKFVAASHVPDRFWNTKVPHLTLADGDQQTLLGG